MMILGISWFWWAIGTFGIVGTGLLIWLAPTVLIEVVKASLSFFLTNRWGNMIAVAIVVFFIADVNRSMRDASSFAEKTAAFEQEQQERDARIAQETRETVTKEMADQAAHAAATDKLIEEFHHALPPIPEGTVNPFLIGSDSCKLRALAGQPGCGPESTPRVPTAGAPAKPAGNHRRFRLPRSVSRLLGRASKGPDVDQSPR